MTWTKRLAPLTVAVAIGVTGVAIPASAATTKSTAKWTAKQCTAYKTAFVKKHPKPTKAQRAAANKVLTRHSCKIKA